MIKSIFKHNNIPFFIIGGQVHNSSAYNRQEMETAWKALELLHANTAEAPVYWSQVEPREGKFNFDELDQLILDAREHRLNLILLWFATWKNGSMQYAPEWVKSDPERFKRVTTHAGNTLWVLSSHSEANWQADCNAFCALLAHLKEFDTVKTVIGIQVENEPGILGAVRDHGAEAEAEFNAPAPDILIKSLHQANEGVIYKTWKSSGGHAQGSWQDLFGPNAAEYFTAWSIASYIGRLAEAGKAVYELPMYANAWLREQGWRRPGETYPSGGPVSSVLDLWKWAAPRLDLLAPDIYVDTPDTYREICGAYTRPDNLLFVPESGRSEANSVNLFEAVVKYNAIGYAVFGVESLIAPDGTVRPEYQSLVESMQCLSAIQLGIFQYWGAGMMHAVTQRESMSEQLFDFGQYLGLARFDSASGGSQVTDFRHQPVTHKQRGRGLIISAPARTFYLVGGGYSLYLRPKRSEEAAFSKAHENFDGPLTQYLRVEEGHYNEFGDFVPDRVRNGDEITGGLWVSPDVGVVRAILTA
jgi:hypothetical protein